jgi:hypothetical protein
MFFLIKNIISDIFFIKTLKKNFFFLIKNVEFDIFSLNILKKIKVFLIKMLNPMF